MPTCLRGAVFETQCMYITFHWYKILFDDMCDLRFDFVLVLRSVSSYLALHDV